MRILQKIVALGATVGIISMASSCTSRKEPSKDDDVKKLVKLEPPKAKVKEYRHDEAAEVDGIKIELLHGSVGKLKQMFFGKFKQSDESHYRIDFRLTNNADNFALPYVGWHGDYPFPDLVDESGNRYRYTPVLDTRNLEERTLAKGQSLEHAVAFALPREDAKDFRLELNCNMIGKAGETIAFKIPRAFFKEK